MTMADRNICRRRDDEKVTIINPNNNPGAGPQSRISPTHQSNQPELNTSGHDLEERASRLDLSPCYSPSLRPGPPTRDSGYNTGDVSPANTISPAINTSRHQHFIFEDIDPNQQREHEGATTSSLGHSVTSYTRSDVASSSPVSHISYTDSFDQRFNIRSRRTPPLRLSPDIFKASPSSSNSGTRNQRTSRTVSESSDTNRVQFDFESDGDDCDDVNRKEEATHRQPVRKAGHFDLSGNLHDLHLAERESDYDDDDDDEDVFYNPGETLRHWGVASETEIPRNRSSSLSLRPRRYCSNTEEDSHLGACGGADSTALYFSAERRQEQRSHSFSGSRQRRPGESLSSNLRHVSSGHGISSIPSRNIQGNIASSLTCSQGFQPGYFDTRDSRDSLPENVFTFDPDDLDGDEDETRTAASQRAATSPFPNVRDKPPQSPASRVRRRRVGVTTHVRLANGCVLPWPSSSCPGSVSVSTQTPHLTSIMIQQILDTPVPLPNEARGSAASRLRRRSESGVPLPPTPTPLPDIVPRDRALSVPDLQELARRHRAREAGRQVGRELRRLSDDFNMSYTGRNLSPVHEEFDGHPASYPRMRNTGRIPHVLSQFGAFLRETFGSRRGSSVDFSSQLASMDLHERSEDEPGD